MKQLIQPQAKAIRNAHQLSLASHFSAFHAVTAVFPLLRGSARPSTVSNEKLNMKLRGNDPVVTYFIRVTFNIGGALILCFELAMK